MSLSCQDLDLYDESRTLLFGTQLARRYKAEVGYNWADLYVALLDNCREILIAIPLLLPDPEKRERSITPQTRNTSKRRNPPQPCLPRTSLPYSSILPNPSIAYHPSPHQPIPLEYLRLGHFDAAPDQRKERAHSSTEQVQARLFDSFRSRYRAMYPFTIFHASAPTNRRYTLYARSEAERERWRKTLEDAVAVRKARQDGNMVRDWSSFVVVLVREWGEWSLMLTCGVVSIFLSNPHSPIITTRLSSAIFINLSIQN